MTDTPKKHHRQKDLLAYAQDFLDPDERRELEEHMQGCADCQKTLEEVRRFLPSLQQALTPKEMSTEEMWSKVKQQARNLPPAKEPFFTRMRLALVVSGAALATTVLIVLQPLLQQVEGGAVAKRPQKPASGFVAAPQRLEYGQDAGPDAGPPPDEGEAH
jgi:anti-sigma factor RsiW